MIIKNKILFIIGIVLLIILIAFYNKLDNFSLIKVIGFVLSGLIIGNSVGIREKEEQK